MLARRQSEPRPQKAPPTMLGVAYRIAIELMVAVVVGAGLGWLLDRFLHTRPIFLIVMFLLGAQSAYMTGQTLWVNGGAYMP